MYADAFLEGIMHSRFIHYSQKLLNLILIMSILVSQNLYAMNLDELEIHERHVAFQQNRIESLREFFRGEDVGERQLHDILKEMENPTPGQQEALQEKLGIVGVRNADALSQDKDFVGLVFLLAKAKKLKELNEIYNQPAGDVSSGVVIIAIAAHLMSTYFLLDCVCNAYAKPFSWFDKETRGVSFALYLAKPFIMCALAVPLLMYYGVVFEPDLRIWQRPSPKRIDTGFEAIKALTHIVGISTLFASMAANFLSSEDIFRSSFPPAIAFVCIMTVVFDSVRFNFMRTYYNYITPPPPENVRIQIVKYVDDRLKKLSHFGADLARIGSFGSSFSDLHNRY